MTCLRIVQSALGSFIHRSRYTTGRGCNIGIQDGSSYGDDIADERARVPLQWSKKICSFLINFREETLIFECLRRPHSKTTNVMVNSASMRPRAVSVRCS